jgi:hypothetical protein
MFLLQHFLFFVPPTLFASPKSPVWSADAPLPTETMYDIWLASRTTTDDNGLLAPGAHRPVTFANVLLAYNILRNHAFELFRTIWVPRTSLVLTFNVFRGFFPAFRGYSQSLIINEVNTDDFSANRINTQKHHQLQSAFSSQSFSWSRLLRLLATECLRMAVESSLDAFALVIPLFQKL